MRILYFSVHAILEFDEIRLFHSLGHTVFPLGTYFGGKASQAFRPEINFDEDFFELMGQFKRMGGFFTSQTLGANAIIPASFIDLFDVVIVMHDANFLHQFWDILSRKPVVWRTIGVDVGGMDSRLKELRRNGLYIVRYSPFEEKSELYIGHDAVIRFSKRTSDYHQWSGTGQFALTFANDFAERFPLEYSLYVSAISGVDARLGGKGNFDLSNLLGLVSYDVQLDLLSRASCYFYTAGTFITYTLNFMEAWLAGAPLIALDCNFVYPEERCKFAEIPSLIEDGTDGFLVNSAKGAHDIMCELISNPDLGRRISSAAIERAKSLFDEAVNASLWQAFLLSIV